MTRLILALVTWISIVSASSASLAPRKFPSVLGNEVFQARASQLPARPSQQAAGQVSLGEFVVTERTEILLNGKPCRYEEIPGHASIVRMEVAADRKTVLKIHFRIGK
jgi:hypothetical protein